MKHVLLLGSQGGGEAFNPNLPLTISGLALWLDADDATTLFQDSAGTTPAASDGDPVGQWADKSGNDRHATQATPGARPTVQLAEQNGRAIIRGDGTDDVMTATITAKETRTLFVVAHKQAASALSKQAWGFASDAQLYANTNDGAGTLYWSTEAGAVVSIGGTVTNWNIIALVFAGLSSCTPRLNGVAGSAFDPKNSYKDAVSLTLLGRPLVAGGDYDLAEVLLFDSALSADDLAAIETYLGTKWSITVP